MDCANYLPKNFWVYSATHRKVQNLPKDRAKKILGVFKNTPSKVYIKLL